MVQIPMRNGAKTRRLWWEIDASALSDQPRETFSNVRRVQTVLTTLKALKSQLFFLDFTIGKTNKMNFKPSNANGHITLNTPVLVRSLKLSNVESSQYLDG